MSEISRLHCTAALCVLEAIMDRPDSPSSMAAESISDANGSWELRDRVADIGYLLEESFRFAADKYPDDLGEAVVCAVGSWDFDAVPLILDLFADRLFSGALRVDIPAMAQVWLEIILPRDI